MLAAVFPKIMVFHVHEHVAFYGRLIDLTTRHRQETEMETERLRTAQLQAERTLEARERAHRQRVKGLEEQVSYTAPISCDTFVI